MVGAWTWFPHHSRRPPGLAVPRHHRIPRPSTAAPRQKGHDHLWYRCQRGHRAIADTTTTGYRWPPFPQPTGDSTAAANAGTTAHCPPRTAGDSTTTTTGVHRCPPFPPRGRVPKRSERSGRGRPRRAARPAPEGCTAGPRRGARRGRLGGTTRATRSAIRGVSGCDLPPYSIVCSIQATSVLIPGTNGGAHGPRTFPRQAARRSASAAPGPFAVRRRDIGCRFAGWRFMGRRPYAARGPYLGCRPYVGWRWYLA